MLDGPFTESQKAVQTAAWGVAEGAGRPEAESEEMSLLVTSLFRTEYFSSRNGRS